MRCDADEGCRTPDVELSGDYHSFAGYGWFLRFHPECCPGGMDGSSCHRDHPDDWAPNPDERASWEDDPEIAERAG